MFLINSNKILGIVTEYNPFHNGHLYHLEASKRQTGAETVVAVMSGHFTQRGEPAIADPWTRAAWAVASGVDLVIELPAVFATASAAYFAYGAVFLLNALGCVDSLCFGSESGDLQQLSQLQQQLKTASPVLNAQIKAQAHRSYSRLRSDFLSDSQPTKDLPLSQANDILGLAYLDALNMIDSAIEPSTIQRIVAGYHDESLSAEIASATAIRKAIQKNAGWDGFLHTMPPVTSDALKSRLASRGSIGPNLDLWQQWILFSLRQKPLEELLQVHDMADGMAQRMKQLALSAQDYESFESQLKTKIYTTGRLKRVMAKMLLGITKPDLVNDLGTDPCYLRILAFNDKGRKLLSEAKPQLPVITNGKHYRPESEAAKRQWAIDCQAADLYALLEAPGHRQGGMQFRKPPVYIRR